MFPLINQVYDQFQCPDKIVGFMFSFDGHRREGNAFRKLYLVVGVLLCTACMCEPLSPTPGPALKQIEGWKMHFTIAVIVCPLDWLSLSLFSLSFVLIPESAEWALYSCCSSENCLACRAPAPTPAPAPAPTPGSTSGTEAAVYRRAS